jgi:hypothetical protein
MADEIKLLPGIEELKPGCELHSGGHNWPDMQVVVDTSDTEIEDDALYLLTCPYGSLKIKRVKRYWGNPNSLMLHPAIHKGFEPIEKGLKEINLLGKTIPVIGSFEFSEGPYRPDIVQIHGRVLGLWEGEKSEDSIGG